MKRYANTKRRTYFPRWNKKQKRTVYSRYRKGLRKSRSKKY